MRLKFLDGLRGWGAVVVLLYHVFSNSLPPAPGFVHLNYVIAFDGRLAVLVFFAVSGFSLTVRYLADGEFAPWLRIASARYLRLAIPILGACAVMHLALAGGFVSAAADRLPDFQFAFKFEPTISHLLRFALWDVFFDYDASQTYIGPLWSMAPELIGSLLVLGAVLVVRPFAWRLPALIGLSLALMFYSPTYLTQLLALFPAGAAIADAYLRGWLDRVPGNVAAGLITIACLEPFVAPAAAWSILVGAVPLTIGCIGHRRIRAWLESSVSSYLGRVSFPLYLMHGPVIVLIGEPLMRGSDGLGSRIGVDLTVIVLSFIAAHAFLPINQVAVQIAQRFGGLCAAAMPIDLGAGRAAMGDGDGGRADRIREG